MKTPLQRARRKGKVICRLPDIPHCSWQSGPHSIQTECGSDSAMNTHMLSNGRYWRCTCPRRKSDRCSLLEWGSNGRRRCVGEDAKSPLDVRPHLLFVLLLRHPCLQLMCKQRAAWGLARSLATSSSASATPPKRGTRHQWCRCWHKMYQTMLSPGTPTLAAVATLWLLCAIETVVDTVESPGRRSGRRIVPLEKVGRRRWSHAHHDEPGLGMVDPLSRQLDPVKENRIRPWRQRIRSRDDGFVGKRAPGIRLSSSWSPTGRSCAPARSQADAARRGRGIRPAARAAARLPHRSLPKLRNVDGLLQISSHVLPDNSH
jgi:hypothetical protein